jgi:hypothetical protein
MAQLPAADAIVMTTTIYGAALTAITALFAILTMGTTKTK